MTPGYLSAIGNTVELIGLVVLAVELWKTTSGSNDNLRELANEEVDATAMVVWQGIDDDAGKGGIDFSGGRIAKIVKIISDQEKEIRSRAWLLAVGVSLSALGALLQVIGGFWGAGQ